MMEYLLPLWLRQYWLERQRQEIPSDIAARLLQSCAKALSVRDPLTLEEPRTCSIQQSFNVVLETQKRRKAAERAAGTGRFPFYKGSSSAPSLSKVSAPSSSTLASASSPAPAALLTMEPSDLDHLNPQEILRLVIYFVKKSRLEYVDAGTCELVHIQGEALENPPSHSGSTLATFDVSQAVLHPTERPLNRHTKALLLIALFCAASARSETLSTPTTPTTPLPMASFSSPSSSPASSASTSPRSRSTPQPSVSHIAAKWIAKLGQALFGFPCAHAGHTHHRRTRASIELMERQKAALDSHFQSEHRRQFPHREDEGQADSPVSSTTVITSPHPIDTTTTTTASTPNSKSSHQTSSRTERWCRHCLRAIHQVLVAAEQYRGLWLHELQQDSGFDILELGQQQTRRQRGENPIDFELVPMHKLAQTRTATITHQTRPLAPDDQTYAPPLLSPRLSPHTTLESTLTTTKDECMSTMTATQQQSPLQGPSESKNTEIEGDPLSVRKSSNELLDHPPKAVSVPLSIPSPISRPGWHHHHNSNSDSGQRPRVTRSMVDKELSAIVAEQDARRPMTRLERDLAEAIMDSTPRCRSAPPRPAASLGATAMDSWHIQNDRMGQKAHRNVDENENIAAVKKSKAQFVDPLLSIVALDLPLGTVDKRREHDLGGGHDEGSFVEEGEDRKDRGVMQDQDGYPSFPSTNDTGQLLSPALGSISSEGSAVDESHHDMDQISTGVCAVSLQEGPEEGGDEDVKDITIFDNETISGHNDAYQEFADVKQQTRDDQDARRMETARGSPMDGSNSEEVRGSSMRVTDSDYCDAISESSKAFHEQTDDQHDHQHHYEDQTNLSVERDQYDILDHSDTISNHSNDGSSTLLSTAGQEDDLPTPRDDFAEHYLLESGEEQQLHSRVQSKLQRRLRLVDDTQRKQEQLNRIKARLEVKPLGKIRPIVSFWEEKGVLEQKSVVVEEVIVGGEQETTAPGPVDPGMEGETQVLREK